MADSESAPTAQGSSSTPLIIGAAIIFVIILASVGIFLATRSTPSPTSSYINNTTSTSSPGSPTSTTSPGSPTYTTSPGSPTSTTSPGNTSSPPPRSTTSPNTKAPPQGGNKSCASDADCVNFGSKTYCNTASKGCDLPPAPCNVNSDCKDSQKPYCHQNSKTCVNARDPCMPLLGDTWFSSDTYGCVPSCINTDKGRSHAGWCKATVKAECPQDGWDIRSVIGNPDGDHKGGQQEIASVCVPVEAKGAPYNWAYDETTQMFVPQCKVTKPFRDEGYCVADTDSDCADGYTKMANYYPHSDSIYICSGKGKNQ